MHINKEITNGYDLLEVVTVLNPRRPLKNYADVMKDVCKIITTMIDCKSIDMIIAYKLLLHFLYVIGDPIVSRQLSEYCLSISESDHAKEINKLLSGKIITYADIVRATYLIKYSTYDSQCWPGADIMPELLGKLPLDRITNALDLGCGTGRAGAMLRKLNYAGRLTGVDLSAPMLGEAQTKGDY